MNQKVVYATSPEANIRYLLSDDLLHAQLLGNLFSFEIIIFGTIEDDFSKKTQKVVFFEIFKRFIIDNPFKFYTGEIDSKGFKL